MWFQTHVGPSLRTPNKDARLQKSENPNMLSKCTDHHKAWQILQIIFLGTIDEIILPYVQTCARANMVPRLEGFYEFAHTQESPISRCVFLQISINLPPGITIVSVWCSKDRRGRELKTSTYHFTRMSHSQIQEIGKIIKKILSMPTHFRSQNLNSKGSSEPVPKCSPARAFTDHME